MLETIEPASIAPSAPAGTQHGKYLAAQPAAEDSDDGVADRAQAEFLHGGARGVSAYGSADQLNEQACDVHDSLLTVVAARLLDGALGGTIRPSGPVAIPARDA